MRQKILIADDEPSVCRAVARTLGAELFEIFTASDGDDALSLAVEDKPDLILLDVNMPKKSGWEVLKELRHNVQTRMTPVILLTGLGAVSDEVFGLDTGADDYVTKPFVADELRARVNSALRRNQLGVSANPLTKLPGSPTIDPGFYAASDRVCGYIETDDHRGMRQRIPIISLSIGIATSDGRRLDHYAKVVQIRFVTSPQPFSL